MDSFDADAVVVGAGAVGLAVARRLALDGHDTLILEKNDHPGMETSARNSEVIHAGIYYPQASLKATLCLAGKHLLYDFCASHGVPHKRLGKLIVGRAGQEAQLDSIARLAAGNGVDDLRPLNRRQIAELEPDVVAEMGLFSLSTGIIDSHQYMLALLGDRTLVRSARVATARPKEGGCLLSVQSGGEELALKTRLLVNAAGLWAQSLAAHIEGLGELPPLFLAKGNYAGLSRKSPFRHLVYPIPEPGGLGIHVTLDMAGRARFGPNVEWLAS
ncbi:MAG TPA: FAD-dependent oxidoreductase, partial [Rhizomicrobium sp.]|nr:FAD-dependent oxidoreductase [Rhizomicrobium sp.]